jgi:hypothetical protein
LMRSHLTRLYLARAGGLRPYSPTLEGAGFLEILFFGVP